MPSTLNADSLARTLPGTWRIGATNFPMWLAGNRLQPEISYRMSKTDPLTLDDEVTFTNSKGIRKSIAGVDRWTGDGFVWRGTGLLMPFTSRWTVRGTAANDDILAIRFSKTLRTPAGLDVITRSVSDSHGFRAAVAGAAVELGLTHEDFASLTWLALER
ncbi:MAG: hypothetical protein QOI70_514 [Microbacteriaceae bacterium]|jgi:hypothetical protein|nr:hypothetical protein [Microbacteriaceae bacterium]